jgi:hypothetical protein
VEDNLKANADPNAGQVVITKSSQLGAAQTAVQILHVLSSLLLIAVFALYALAIYLPRGRRRLLLGATGVSLVLVGLVIAFLQRFLGGVIVDSLVKVEANKQPVSVIWAIETSLMRDIAIILVVYGALVLLATVLAGQNRPAVAIRRWLAATFRHPPIVVWLAALEVFLILLAWGPTAGNQRLLGVELLAATTAMPSRPYADKRYGSSQRASRLRSARPPQRQKRGRGTTEPTTRQRPSSSQMASTSPLARRSPSPRACRSSNGSTARRVSSGARRRLTARPRSATTRYRRRVSPTCVQVAVRREPC